MEYENIKKIYEKLQDDESREIFENRLLYSLTGKKSYVDRMILDELKRFGDMDQMNRCISWLNDKHITSVSIFGAGFAGFQIVRIFNLLGIDVFRIYDNDSNKWGEKCYDLEICSPDKISIGENIILGVNAYRDEIIEQISGKCSRTDIYIPDGLWWLGKYPQYFDEDILPKSSDEIFVDRGSLDGGDSLNFAKWCSSNYKKIYAFEPDNKNVAKMEEVSESLNDFKICPIGMWSEKSTLRFTSGISENCAISEDGDTIVEVDSIDNVLNGDEATFIKMDIEGSEFQALIGAENTIKKYKPKLAICVYHKPEDIVDIPMKILELNPNYKFWLRHYSYVDTETVLYAVDEGEYILRQVIYGAQAIALGAYKALKTVYPDKEVECFLVTSMGNNQSLLCGLPVRELNDYVSGLSDIEKDVEILICTPESVMSEIERSLDDVGLHNYRRIDSVKWAELQERFFKTTGKYAPLINYSVGNSIPDVEIYKMVHIKDKKLITEYVDPYYVSRIQIGAALCNERNADITDDIGDNISIRNKNYSELTGLYWIWKNKIQSNNKDKYFGICHYRRFLDFTDDDFCRIQGNDIDVVLPYPMPYEPTIEEHHKRYLSDDEWSAVIRAIVELQPDYANALDNILGQEYLYNYNIILAKSDVLDAYCSWLFPILFRVEEIVDPKGDKEPNRYIGYIGETLETVYFMHNKDRLRIAHVGCRFLT